MSRLSQSLTYQAIARERTRTSSGITGKTANSGQGAAESGAVGARNRTHDPELAAVVAAWADLPEAVRAGIVAMVRAASNGDGE